MPTIQRLGFLRADDPIQTDLRTFSSDLFFFSLIILSFSLKFDCLHDTNFKHKACLTANGFKQKVDKYLLGLVIWCSFWTFRVIWIKTRFRHIASGDSSLYISRKVKRRHLVLLYLAHRGRSQSGAEKNNRLLFREQ